MSHSKAVQLLFKKVFHCIYFALMPRSRFCLNEMATRRQHCNVYVKLIIFIGGVLARHAGDVAIGRF